MRVLPPRGSTDRGDQRLWRVARIEKASGERLAHLEPLGDENRESTTVIADDLVVVAEFDFGTDFRGRPVSDILGQRFPVP